MPDPVIVRHAMRAILLDLRERRVLLIRARAPSQNVDFWLTPGGGQENDETPLETLQREVWEETGHALGGLPHPVWKRQHTYAFDGRLIEQHELFYLQHVEVFEPTAEHNPAAAEMAVFQEFRWWSIAEIEASSEMFVPGQLGEHLAGLLVDPQPPAVISLTS